MGQSITTHVISVNNPVYLLSIILYSKYSGATTAHTPSKEPLAYGNGYLLSIRYFWSWGLLGCQSMSINNKIVTVGRESIQ